MTDGKRDTYQEMILSITTGYDIDFVILIFLSIIQTHIVWMPRVDVVDSVCAVSARAEKSSGPNVSSTMIDPMKRNKV